MTTYLVATASVHTTAAACDYLRPRVSADDTVLAVSVTEPGVEDRDAGDALNVVRTRLPEPTVETTTRDGGVTGTIRSLVDEWNVDVVVIGPRHGAPGTGDELGGTATAVLESLDVPVVVVPLPDL